MALFSYGHPQSVSPRHHGHANCILTATAQVPAVTPDTVHAHSIVFNKWTDFGKE